MFKSLVVVLISFATVNYGYSQEETKHPFTVKTSIKNGNSDSTKIVSVTIINRSFNTYFISNHSLNVNYTDKSLCLFSLSYARNYSDPLLMPHAKLEFWKLKPFKTITLHKELSSNYIAKVFLDFDFFDLKSLKGSIRSSIKDQKERMIILTNEQFFNEIFFRENSNHSFMKEITLNNKGQ